jgi:hypothetical protein
MAEVRYVNLAGGDRVENEIAQTSSDNYTGVWFVRFSSLKRVVGELPRTFYEADDKT